MHVYIKAELLNTWNKSDRIKREIFFESTIITVDFNISLSVNGSKSRKSVRDRRPEKPIYKLDQNYIMFHLMTIE